MIFKIHGVSISKMTLSLFQCDRTASIDQFFQSVPSSDPPVLALLGSGCSVATEPVAEIIHHWNISQVYVRTYSLYILGTKCSNCVMFVETVQLYNYVWQLCTYIGKLFTQFF